MAKKFFTASLSSNKYRIFMEDLSSMIKRTKKVRPPIPQFASRPAGPLPRKDPEDLKDRNAD